MYKKILLTAFLAILLLPSIGFAADCTSDIPLSSATSTSDSVYHSYTCNWDEKGVGFCRIDYWKSFADPCMKVKSGNDYAGFEADSNIGGSQQGGVCVPKDSVDIDVCGMGYDKYHYIYEDYYPGGSGSGTDQLILNYGDNFWLDVTWDYFTEEQCIGATEVNSHDTSSVITGEKCCPDGYKLVSDNSGGYKCRSPKKQCNNNRDDDGDDLTDYCAGGVADGCDPSCDDSSDDSEAPKNCNENGICNDWEGSGCIDCGDVPPCRDGIDNDGDGFCDTSSYSCTDGSIPGDPGCEYPGDQSEGCNPSGAKCTSNSACCSGDCYDDTAGSCSNAQPTCQPETSSLTDAWTYDVSNCKYSGSGGCNDPYGVTSNWLYYCSDTEPSCSSGDGCKTGCTPPDTDCSCSQIGGTCCKPSFGKGEHFQDSEGDYYWDSDCDSNYECWSDCAGACSMSEADSNPNTDLTIDPCEDKFYCHAISGNTQRLYSVNGAMGKDIKIGFEGGGRDCIDLEIFSVPKKSQCDGTFGNAWNGKYEECSKQTTVYKTFTQYWPIPCPTDTANVGVGCRFNFINSGETFTWNNFQGSTLIRTDNDCSQTIAYTISLKTKNKEECGC